MDLTNLESFLIDYPKACENLVSKVYQTKIIENPCPHFFINDWLPDFWATGLIKSIPPQNIFTSVEGGGSILDSKDAFGYQWCLYFSLIQKILWQQLPRFSSWFNDIKYQVDETFYGNSWEIKSEPNVICLTNPLIGVPPHTDGESSILTAITVLGYPDFTPAPVTNFYSENPPVEPVTFYPPSRNSLLIFLNRSGFSKHGVIEEIKPNRITHIAGVSATKIEDPVSNLFIPTKT